VVGRAVRAIPAAALILAVGGCASSGERLGQTFTGPGYEAKLFSADLAAAPLFRATTITGKSLSLAAYRGHEVVLNFWGSWCDACRDDTVALEYRNTVPLQALPDTVIISRTGQVAATIIGSTTDASLTMLIAKAGKDG
jgi:thiol-disulfide isomerase/thioredoxin